MVDPVGLTMGIAGLAGVFTACVDCFEYVQLGRQFGKDYGKCLLRLDTAKLRMSRWGVAVGLGPQPHLRTPQFSASDKDIRLVQSLLEQILDSFEDAERLSERFKKHTARHNPGSTELLLCNATSDMNSDYQDLHLTMRQLALKRQKGTSVLKKAAWALYEKKRFEILIEEVTGFTNQLVGLFDGTQNHQRALCMTEVSAIDSPQHLALLNNIAAEDDPMFSAEITEELEKRGHNVTDWKANGSSRMWIGDENAAGVDSKGHNAARFTVSDQAYVRIGNVNAGKEREE